MSSSDKAKSKLLDSMRMSKQGVSANVTAANAAPAKKVEPAKKVKQTASKPTGTAKKSQAAAKSTSVKSAVVKKPVIDNFQAAQRVWPD